MRSKETSDDYRYFPEPDLPPLHVDPSWLEALRAGLPELPAARRSPLPGVAGPRGVRRRGAHRRSRRHGAVRGDHGRRCVAPREVGRELGHRGVPPPAQHGERGRARARRGDASSRRSSGRSRTGRSRAPTPRRSSRPTSRRAMPRRRSSRSAGFRQISDTGVVGAAVDEVLAANPAAVADYRGRQGPGGRLPRGPGHEGDARPGQRRARPGGRPRTARSGGVGRAHGTRQPRAVGARRRARRHRLHARPGPVGALPGAQGPGRERRPLRVVARRPAQPTRRPAPPSRWRSCVARPRWPAPSRSSAPSSSSWASSSADRVRAAHAVRSPGALALDADGAQARARSAMSQRGSGRRRWGAIRPPPGDLRVDLVRSPLRRRWRRGTGRWARTIARAAVMRHLGRAETRCHTCRAAARSVAPDAARR